MQNNMELSLAQLVGGVGVYHLIEQPYPRHIFNITNKNNTSVHMMLLILTLWGIAGARSSSMQLPTHQRKK